eukprot:6173713-Pleurochrysis_carterae.AAC.3
MRAVWRPDTELRSKQRCGDQRIGPARSAQFLYQQRVADGIPSRKQTAEQLALCNEHIQDWIAALDTVPAQVTDQGAQARARARASRLCVRAHVRVCARVCSHTRVCDPCKRACVRACERQRVGARVGARGLARGARVGARVHGFACARDRVRSHRLPNVAPNVALGRLLELPDDERANLLRREAHPLTLWKHVAHTRTRASVSERMGTCEAERTACCCGAVGPVVSGHAHGSYDASACARPQRCIPRAPSRAASCVRKHAQSRGVKDG